MFRNTSRKCVSGSLMLALTACVWLLAPGRADAVGVAFCFLVHGEAGDDIEYVTTVKYALMERASRTEASQAARAEAERHAAEHVRPSDRAVRL